MKSRLLSILTLTFAMSGTMADPPANVAELEVGNRRTNFKQFIAFAAVDYGQPRWIVVATGSPISASVLKKIKEKPAEENYDLEIDQPYMKAIYETDGTIIALAGRHATGTFLSRAGLRGKATLSAGSLEGYASLEEEGTFAKKGTLKFVLPFDVPPVPGQKPVMEPPVKPTVSGEFIGNGKKAAIKFVSVLHHEEFNGKRAITLLFTEKDHSKDPKPSIKAAFRHYGSALILHVNEDGGLFGCEVVHAAHTKSPFTALGEIAINDFEMLTGNAKGQVQTPGELDTFGEKWSVDLKFAAPLPAESIKELMTEKKEEDSAKAEAMEDDDEDEDDEEEDEDDDDEEDDDVKKVVKKKPTPKKEVVPTIKVTDLPLPKSVKNVTYKSLVKQLTFESDGKVQPLAADLQKSFAAAGWKSAATPLVTARSAIIELSQGDARLTVMLRPKGNASEGSIFSKNLDWSGTEGKKGKSSDDEEEESDEAIEKEALDTIDKALKDVLPR
jgi:hypothetical protein